MQCNISGNVSAQGQAYLKIDSDTKNCQSNQNVLEYLSKREVCSFESISANVEVALAPILVNIERMHWNDKETFKRIDLTFNNLLKIGLLTQDIGQAKNQTKTVGKLSVLGDDPKSTNFLFESLKLLSQIYFRCGGYIGKFELLDFFSQYNEKINLDQFKILQDLMKIPVSKLGSDRQIIEVHPNKYDSGLKDMVNDCNLFKVVVDLENSTIILVLPVDIILPFPQDGCGWMNIDICYEKTGADYRYLDRRFGLIIPRTKADRHGQNRIIAPLALPFNGSYIANFYTPMLLRPNNYHQFLTDDLHQLLRIIDWI